MIVLIPINVIISYMKKVILLISILFLTTLNANAKSFEDAMNSPKPFAMYIYMQGCSACRAFDPIFYQMQNKYSYKYNFVREEYRQGLMPQLCQKWKVRSFPYMALVNPKTNNSKRVSFECFWDEKCLNQAFESFP